MTTSEAGAPRKRTVSSRILVVEDDAIIARDIRATLAELGYAVTATVASGGAAIDVVESERPHLILMDVHIRGPLDGIETAARIRERWPTPVVYLTSYSDDATIQRAKKTGAYGYVLKPFTDRDLRTAIEVALQKHEIEQRLAERERWFATTLKAISDAVIAVDTAGCITFINAAAETLTGLAAADALGRSAIADSTPVLDLFRADRTTRVATEDMPIVRALAGETVHQAEMFVRAPGALEGRWHSINASPVFEPNGATGGAVIVSRDITELRHAIEQLERAAVRDDLTGLLNRRGFQDRATQALSLANRTARPLALIYIDLNGMKTINDRFGHAAGDRALVEMAELMRRTFRTSDVLARLGGDEFAVLAPEYTQEDEGATVHVRFRRELNKQRHEAERPFELSASLGVTIYDPRYGLRTMEQLVEDADAKMYAAKQRRRVEGTQRMEKLP